MVILLLSGVWEIEKTEVYHLDKNGKRKVYLKNTEEWKDIPEGEEGPLYESLKEEITNLENNKQYITTYYTAGVGKDIDISSTNIPAVIKEHNQEVKDLVKKIKIDRINLGNPWVGLWVNPACNNVDLVRVEATYINSLA